MNARRAVVFLFGPTAVGKTAALSALAGRPVEVVSADSIQVYRRMDVGTAKPEPDLLARVPHHLIDIRDPDEQYDVGAFVADANHAIDDILARRRLPVVAGGTGFYFRNLLYGLPATPPSDPLVRERILGLARQHGIASLYDRLLTVDPTTAERIGASDRYRIVRALEVFEQTGRPLSSFAVGSATRADIEVTSIIMVRDRAELRDRIGRRVSAMFAAGLRAEVERLISSGYGREAPGMRAIGYREFFRVDGSLRPPAEDPAIEHEIVVSTRRYAKRQQTFFRQLPAVLELPADDISAVVTRIDDVLGELDSV